eukprot:TRINITY_DN18450_c0_g1_i10.p1 TRINITY_DN18450_c0_g1~~TRINITY_DN18450_c0_g1_i10.p1  ORF type:complete len:898 (+),score=161.13 TRINITY_DN18450_c0_g1_i10:232-2925(+)
MALVCCARSRRDRQVARWFRLLCVVATCFANEEGEEARHISGAGGHVWIDDPGAADGYITAGQSTTLRWSHFLAKDAKEKSASDGYAWIFLYHHTEDEYVDSLTGNTAASGSWSWQVPTKHCGKWFRVRVCSGDPPRTSKYACHQSAMFEVRGTCRRVPRPSPPTPRPPPRKERRVAPPTKADSSPQQEEAQASASTNQALHRLAAAGLAGDEEAAHVGDIDLVNLQIKELGPLPLEGRKKWLSLPPQSSESPPDASASERLTTPPTVASVALVVLWLGDLPWYAAPFAASATDAGPTFLVYYTGEGPEPPARPRVHFRHLPLKELAARLWQIPGLDVHLPGSLAETEARVADALASDNGPKGNDLKAVYGALFAQELVNYTHWGWTDLDIFWGDLRPFLPEDVLTEYDVFTAPDGFVPALYLSGQLTVFKNTKHWQTFFLGCLRDRDQESMRHGGCMADAFLEEAHNYWDEKVAIWYVAGRKGRIRVDFSVQLSTKLWQNLGQQYRLLRSSGASGGKMVVELEPGKLRSVLPHVDIERLNMGLHKLREVSNCYSEFGNWSFACLPYTSPGDSSVQGVAYEVTASGIRPVASPLRASSTGALEFGFLHLHTSKEECAVERAALESGRWDCELVKSKKWGVRCQASLLEVVQTTPPIPNIVHFVLTDRDTRFFDWTCYAAVKSAWERLRPTELMVHLLDGVEPTTANEWWLAALRYVTRVLPFDRAAVPIEINGVYLRHPAMIGDFYRMQVLYDWGGIYMDTDAMSLRSFDELRWYRAVFARQGGKELRPAVGLMMFEPRSSITARLLGKMKEAYDGVWAVHSVHALDQALRESPPRGAAILGHNAGGFFASSWDAAYLSLVRKTGIQTHKFRQLLLWSTSERDHNRDWSAARRAGQQ